MAQNTTGQPGNSNHFLYRTLKNTHCAGAKSQNLHSWEQDGRGPEHFKMNPGQKILKSGSWPGKFSNPGFRAVSKIFRKYFVSLSDFAGCEQCLTPK